MLARLRKNRQLTLPARIGKVIHLEEGDMLDVQVDDGKIVLTPQKLIDKSQAWYWTPAWQAAEKEADEQIARGEVMEFDSVEDMIRELDEGRE